MEKKKNLWKWLAAIVASPFVLFLVLAILIYIPPVQNFVVHRVSEHVSKSMGIDFSVDEVRLAFPLDLALHRTTAIEKGDTLLDARSMRVHVQLLPLFEGRADVDGLELYGVKLDTKSYIPDTHIKGHADELTAVSHGIDWQNELVHLDRARLRGADLQVCLSDTAQKDTTPSTAHWKIMVAKADIETSRVRLSMPGDSMRIGASIGTLALRDGAFDTGTNNYAFRSLLIGRSALTYDVPQAKPTEGIDPNHISISDLSLRLDTLSYTAQGVLRAGLQKATLKEKCGLAVHDLSGSVYMDSARLVLPALT